MLHWAHIKHYKQLMRMDKPIGTLLLLWPTFWALWLANNGLPSLNTLIIFTLGVFLMRSAGCVINDYADRHIDGHVKRTSSRPLASGKVTEKETLHLFFLMVLCAFACVLFLNIQTIALSVVALLLASVYPFMKRVTYYPQIVLGMAFGWSIPMAFMASTQSLPNWLWWIYVANLVWTVAYDTLYAMVDKDDDIRIGVKSTAIIFGLYDKLIVGILQFAFLLIWLCLGIELEFGLYFWSSLFVCGALFFYQQWLVKSRERNDCFAAFLNNNYVGLALFLGIFLEFQFQG